MISSNGHNKLKNKLKVRLSLYKQIRKILISLTPDFILNQIKKKRDIRRFNANLKLFDNYPSIEKKIQSKSIINVAFFVVEVSMWKYDELFKIFLSHPLYNPKVVICPYLNYNGSQMERIMNEAVTFFQNKKYPFITTYVKEKDSFIELKKDFEPDIIFYCFPYLQATKEDLYGMHNFPNSLFCYVPYSSMVCSAKLQFDKEIQNFSWAFFVENELVKRLLNKYSPTKGINVISTGFPSLDIYHNKNYKPKNVWLHNRKIKLIWAPHYTIIDDMVEISFSTFLSYYDIMVELARKYRDEIQIAFKPHPFLYPTLCSYWGKEKTDNYFDIWKNSENTQYVTGEYSDLFITSDAMIFDSVSFIVEYLYTKKPSLFTYKNGAESQLNEFGLKAFECHEKAINKDGIEDFIIRLIEGNCNSLNNQKEKFYNDYLALPHGKTASMNIFDYINEKLR